jgi:hypothetical protein
MIKEIILEIRDILIKYFGNSFYGCKINAIKIMARFNQDKIGYKFIPPERRERGITKELMRANKRNV